MRYRLTPERVAIIKRQSNNKDWWQCRVTGTLIHCWWECKMARPLEPCLVVPKNAKQCYRVTQQFYTHTLTHTHPREWKTHPHESTMHTHSSVINSSGTRRLKITQVPSKWQTAKQNVVSSREGILSSREKEWSTDTCYNVEEPSQHCRWRKPDTHKPRILCDFLDRKYPE